MRAAWLIALSVVAACKDKSGRSEPIGAVKKPLVTYVSEQCEQALFDAEVTPPNAIPQLLISACHVCDQEEWAPLMGWNADPASGGPRSEQIERVMVACDAFCTGDAKMKFMAGVDKARGHSVNTPWRLLADTCKDKVNAAVDTRFMSAPYFALDRIARAAKNPSRRPHQHRPTDLGVDIWLPLPALTVTGAGVALPEVQAALRPAGELQITVLGDQLYIGTLPRAKLTAGGLAVDLGANGYPGLQVKLEDLGLQLQAFVGTQKWKTITLLAPQAMTADKLVDVIATASTVAPVYLAAVAPESPTGWQLPGDIPVTLAAGNDLVVTPEMTVQNLARELVARKQSKVGVTKH